MQSKRLHLAYANNGVTYCTRGEKHGVYWIAHIITSDYLLPQLISEWAFTHDSRIRNVIKSKCFVCVHHNPRVIIRATVAFISQGGAKAKVKVYKIRFARPQHQSWLIWSNLTAFFSAIGSYWAAKNSLISPGVFFFCVKIFVIQSFTINEMVEFFSQYQNITMLMTINGKSQFAY